MAGNDVTYTYLCGGLDTLYHVLFLFFVIVAIVSNIILDKIGANRYDTTFNPFRSRTYLKKLYMDALDKRESGILTLFAIAMVSTVLCIILFIVVL